MARSRHGSGKPGHRQPRDRRGSDRPPWVPSRRPDRAKGSTLSRMQAEIMTHNELMAKIANLARNLGVDVFSIPDSRNVTSSGWPDLCLAGAGGVAFPEVKVAPDDLSAAQRRWGARRPHARLHYPGWGGAHRTHRHIDP